MSTRSIDRLVEEHVRRWELEQRQADRPPQPCVALSRAPRSGADELGRAIAERLDFEFFGIEIVDLMARESGIQPRLIEGLDEHVRTAIDRYVGDAFRIGAVTESAYLRQLVRTLATLGERGRAVILGRGSPYVLKPKRTLRVLVTAPRSFRLERLARESALSGEGASAQLEREDNERREFLGHHFGVDPDDPTLYDLVVNTGTLGLDAATALVADALARKPGMSARPGR